MIEKLFQRLPAFKGKLRLAKHLILGQKQERRFIIPNGLMFCVPNLTENVSFELFVTGSYEKSTLQLIQENLPMNSVFIDIGANIGAISVILAKQRPDVTIHAFEASPRIFKYLEINKIQNNLDNLNIYNLAIHPIDDVSLPFYSPIEKNGKGSFSPVYTNVPEMVRTLSIETFLKTKTITPNLFKVDVEGYEKLIFESMSCYISSSTACVIIFEFVDWAERLAGYEPGAAQQYLMDKKYKLSDLSTNRNLTHCKTVGFSMILATKS
jgi:FkbM family methyltransferase